MVVQGEKAEGQLQVDLLSLWSLTLIPLFTSSVENCPYTPF